jgi:hypothetical protein
MEVGRIMKYLVLLLLISTASAQVLTDRTTGTTERFRDRFNFGSGDVVAVLPPNVVRVTQGEAFARIYLTTDTVTTRAAVRYRDDGTTFVRVVERVTVDLIKPRTYTLRLRDDYFYWEPNGKYYRALFPHEPGYIMPAPLGVNVN